MQAFGLAPIYAYPLAVTLFLVFSYLLFAKGGYAPYLYAGIALLPLSLLGGKQRGDFLRICFRKKDFLRIRILENFLFISPFLVYLLIEGAYLAALFLFVLGVGFLFFAVSRAFTHVLPTPFGKKPFEFPIGFRRYFGGFILIYFIALMGLRVDNLPLMAFTLGAIFALSSSFYNWVEPPYFVWHYHLGEKDFLGFKVKTAVSSSGLLAAPIWISMLVFYPNKWWITLLISLWAIGFLTAFLLAKYAVFPRLASLPEALWLTAGVLFPPLLLWLNIYFYRKAIHNLKPLL